MNIDLTVLHHVQLHPGRTRDEILNFIDANTKDTTHEDRKVVFARIKHRLTEIAVWNNGNFVGHTYSVQGQAPKKKK